MSTGQVSFSKLAAVALEGDLADGGYTDSISKVLTDAAGIGPGRLVKGGTTYGESCAALTTVGDAADLALGITRNSRSQMPTTPMHLLGDDLALLRQGRIWLICVDDMSAVPSGSAVHVVTSGANAGRPQLSAVTADFCPFLVVLKGGAASALGLFEIRLP